MKRITSVFALVLSCCLCFQTGSATAAAIMGTGGKTGVYYPVGKAICRMVNNRSERYGYRYDAKKSTGSVANIKAVMRGNIEIGFAQSDRQYEAYNGSGAWRSDGPQRDLRAICSIYSEVITLIASGKSGISSLDDLSRTRLNMGNRGSGQYKNAVDVLDAAGVRLGDIEIKKVKAVNNHALLEDDKIDAFFFTAGHPNKMIQALSSKVPIVIIPITGPGIEALIRQYPYYTKSRIRRSLYPSVSNRSDIDSIGVKATLITSKKINDHVIYSLVKEMFENLDDLRRCHPALRDLDKREMLEGLTAPIHDGAMLYYREAGLSY